MQGLNKCWGYRLPNVSTPKMASVNVIMSKFNNTPKIYKILSNAHIIGGAHLQCVNNHYAKFENKGMKTVGVTDHHLSIFDGKNV